MDDLVRDSVSGAREVWEASQRAVRSFDLDGFVDVFAPDGELEFPFAPSTLPRRMEGQEEIRRGLEPLWQQAAASTRITGYSSVDFHPSVDADEIVVEFDLNGEAIATGEAFRFSYVHVVRVRDGRIMSLRDYWNPLALAGLGVAADK